MDRILYTFSTLSLPEKVLYCVMGLALVAFAVAWGEGMIETIKRMNRENDK